MYHITAFEVVALVAKMESARTKHQISPEIFLCSKSAFRECGVHGPEPVCHGNRLGGAVRKPILPSFAYRVRLGSG